MAPATAIERSAQGTQAAPLRLPDGSLDVAYAAQDPDGTNTDLLTALIAANGAVSAGPAIATGWNGVSGPSLILQPGGVAAFFGGLHSTDSADPNQDLNVAGAPAAGGPWTIAPGTASATDGASGQPAVTWILGAPAATAGYYVRNRSTLRAGPPVGRRLPSSPGRRAPGGPSASRARGRRSPAVPAGRDSFTALAGGYPVQNRIVVWRVGAPKSTVISTDRGSVRNVAVAADAAGRVWVTWARETDAGTKLFASRSNPAVTAFETPVSVRLPAGATDSFALAAGAQPKTLDVVGTFGPGPSGAAVAISSTQLAPGEDVKVAPLRVRAGTPAVAVVRVSDAGIALAGARVMRRPAGRRRAAAAHKAAGVRTNAAGVARLRLGSFRRTTTVRLRVTKAGFATRTVTVRVKVR